MHEYAQTSQTSFFSLCMHYLSHCLEDGFHTQIFDSSNTLIQQSILFVTKSTYQRQPFLCPLYCKSHVCMFQSPRLYQMLWNNIMLAFLNNMVKFSQYSHSLTWLEYATYAFISLVELLVFQSLLASAYDTLVQWGGSESVLFPCDRDLVPYHLIQIVTFHTYSISTKRTWTQSLLLYYESCRDNRVYASQWLMLCRAWVLKT